jgi:hypothetical protein
VDIALARVSRTESFSVPSRHVPLGRRNARREKTPDFGLSVEWSSHIGKCRRRGAEPPPAHTRAAPSYARRAPRDILRTVGVSVSRACLTRASFPREGRRVRHAQHRRTLPRANTSRRDGSFSGRLRLRRNPSPGRRGGRRDLRAHRRVAPCARGVRGDGVRDWERPRRAHFDPARRPRRRRVAVRPRRAVFFGEGSGVPRHRGGLARGGPRRGVDRRVRHAGRHHGYVRS